MYLTIKRISNVVARCIQVIYVNARATLIAHPSVLTLTSSYYEKIQLTLTVSQADPARDIYRHLLTTK